MEQVGKSENQSFWEHLDVLRASLVKIAIVTVAFGVVAFFFKDELFAVILAPKEADFITYRLLFSLSGWMTGAESPDFFVKLINTGLAEQFLIHMKVAMCMGILCASPYILYQLFRFVSPALYSNERKYVVRVVGSGYVMFMLGVLLSYFLIFPLTFRFLGTYQVSSDVENMIALQSYISTLILMSLAMGIVFEIPILSWLFAKRDLSRRFYETLSTSCRGNYSYRGCCYNPDIRYIHVVIGGIADVVIVRGEYLDCETYCSVNMKSIILS